MVCRFFTGVTGVQQDEMHIHLQYKKPQDEVTKDRAIKCWKQGSICKLLIDRVGCRDGALYYIHTTSLTSMVILCC